MSRTDKDTPRWVRAQHAADAVIHHTYGCDLSPFRPREPAHERPCDLDARDGRCYRWDRNGTGRYYDDPSNAEIHLGYYGPERAHVRDLLRGAVREYNAHGETDLEPVTRQHRHTTWTGDYWD